MCCALLFVLVRLSLSPFMHVCLCVLFSQGRLSARCLGPCSPQTRLYFCGRRFDWCRVLRGAPTAARVHTGRQACSEAPAQLVEQVLCEHARSAQHLLHGRVLSAVVARRCALASTLSGCVLLTWLDVWMCVLLLGCMCVCVAGRLDMCEPTHACRILIIICCLLVAREGRATPAEGCVWWQCWHSRMLYCQRLEVTATQRDHSALVLSR